MTVGDFFTGYPESLCLYETLTELIHFINPMEIRITKSQISLWHGRTFAWIWIPEKHLHRKAAPLVLSIIFYQRDPSPRWKQIVEPTPGRFMHHLEIYTASEMDEQVLAWLQTGWTIGGNPR